MSHQRPPVRRGGQVVLIATLACSAAGGSAAGAQLQLPGAPVGSVSGVGSITGVSDAGRTVQVITRLDIDRSTARNVGELLAMHAGVDAQIRSPAQADLVIRGGSAGHTLLLVDGVRVSDARSAHHTLDLAVPLAAIERVELLKGAASALYGPDAVAGVVNIVTRAQFRGREVGLRAGAWRTTGANALYGVTGKGWNVSPSIEYEKSDGWRPGTDHRIGSARMSILRAKGPERIEARAGTAVREFGANGFYAPYNSQERTGATAADVRWQTLRRGWLASATASTRYHTDRITLVRDRPGSGDDLHRSWQSGGSIAARRTFTGGAFAFVGDAMHYQLESSRLGDRRELRQGAATQVTWGRNAGATLDIGARADHSSEYGGMVSPSVAFSAPLSEFVRFRANGSRAFRQPTWTERFDTDAASRGNAGLVPERFWSGEAGLRIVEDASTLDIVYFMRRAEELVDWVRPAGAGSATPWQAANVGSADYAGWDGSLTLASTAGVTYMLAMMEMKVTEHERAGLAGRYALRPLTSQRSLRMSWPAADNAVMSIEAIQARRLGEDAYVTGRARLTWLIRPGWEFLLDATNVANAEWPDASGTIAAGRALHATLRWRGD